MSSSKNVLVLIAVAFCLSVIVVSMLFLAPRFGWIRSKQEIAVQSLSVPPTPSVEPSTNSDSIEGVLVGAAASYLSTANEQGMRVAQSMAGATNGRSSLGDIKDAIEKAKFVEMSGYEGDYKRRLKGIPKGYESFAGSVDETHRLFQSAMREYLVFWQDGNVAHIQSGNAVFQRCTLLMNSTIADGTRLARASRLRRESQSQENTRN